MKLLLLSTALAAFALPALADTNCELVDHGGYSSFVRGCDTDGSTGNRPEKVKAPVAPADPDPTPVDPEPVDPGEPTDPVDPPADPDPQPEPEPETPTEPSLPDPEVGNGPEPEAPGEGEH